MAETRIDIIVPVYNRAAIVNRTLDTIAAQSFRNFHLVLVDNNSSDNTLDVLNAFKMKHGKDFAITVVQETKPGATAARNAGFRASNSEWVMFFDSDDLMDTDLVESYINRIDSTNNTADLIVTRVEITNLDGSHREYPYFESNLIVHHLFHASLATQRFVARRSIVERAGGWNESLPCWNDWEFGFRLLLQHPRLAFVSDKVRVHVIATADSITGTGFSSKHGRWELSIEAIEALLRQSAEPQRDRLLHCLEFRRVALAAEYQREGHPELAHPLMDSVSRKVRNNPVMRCLYPLCFTYISHGGRGISHLVKLLVH